MPSTRGTTAPSAGWSRRYSSTARSTKGRSTASTTNRAAAPRGRERASPPAASAASGPEPGRFLAHRGQRRVARPDLEHDVANLEQHPRAAVGQPFAVDRQLGLGRAEPAAGAAREQEAARRHRGLGSHGLGRVGDELVPGDDPRRAPLREHDVVAHDGAVAQRDARPYRRVADPDVRLVDLDVIGEVAQLVTALVGRADLAAMYSRLSRPSRSSGPDNVHNVSKSSRSHASSYETAMSAGVGPGSRAKITMSVTTRAKMTTATIAEIT